MGQITMTNLGFEHKGKYIDENQKFPVYEHIWSNFMCKITISSVKMNANKEYVALEYPKMEMVVFYSHLYAMKSNISFTHREEINIETETKESIKKTIEKIQDKYNKEYKYKII